ncbi:MAG: V-type ATP synthase subunit E [Oscillospiraceae bacterium]|jgi:V/A-type H+-transporting ATPase subunit E|nr:V-type ATP synthase subunit E [Oscillospiraceae bacterium]
MNGIEKITAKIIEDARAEADEIKRASDAERAEIAERYRAEADAETAKILEAGKLEAARQTELLASTANAESKKAILTEKQLLIAEAFELAAQKLESVPDGGKFNVQLVKSDGTTESKRDTAMALKYRRDELTPKVAEILFSE